MQNVKILVGDALERLSELPDESVHCVVTSPPYWGLRDYGTNGQLGLEATLEEHVERMVGVFREVRRVMRHDATLWLNYGDSYAASSRKEGGHDFVDGEKKRLNEQKGTVWASGLRHGLKPKDLVGMPWRVALGLQADGWYLRSDIIWHKPNPMPESVRDRPTKSHEHMFLLAKSKKYYYDADAVREPHVEPERSTGRLESMGTKDIDAGVNGGFGLKGTKPRQYNPAGRNLRDVWTIATHSFKGAHFATFPPKLVEPCIKAGTSEEGCCSICGAPRYRVTDRVGGPPKGDHRLRSDGVLGGKTAHSTGTLAGSHLSNVYKKYGYAKVKTVGWRSDCEHDAIAVACTVLDPFGGAGTVGLVANRLGRSALLIELNKDYAEMARKRISDDCPMLVNVELES